MVEAKITAVHAARSVLFLDPCKSWRRRASRRNASSLVLAQLEGEFQSCLRVLIRLGVHNRSALSASVLLVIFPMDVIQGDYVVKHFGFNLEDALHLEAALGFDGVEGILGYPAEAAVGFGGGASQISYVFPQQLRQQPRAPLGSDLLDEEIVTGLIPPSPISKRRAAGVSLGFSTQLAIVRPPGPPLVGWATNSPRRRASALRIIFRQVSLSAAA